MIVGKHGGFTAYPLEFVALGLLMNGPKHGYALYRDFTLAFDLIWHAEQAKFYGILAALEEKGHLRITTELQEKRPARKVYHITASGHDAFLEWVGQPVTSMRAVRVEFMAKLRFHSLLDLGDIEKFIDHQMFALQAMLMEWEQTDQPESDPIRIWVKDFRRRQALFMIEWLAVCKQDARQRFTDGDAPSSS